jgi:hypothetical protein
MPIRVDQAFLTDVINAHRVLADQAPLASRGSTHTVIDQFFLRCGTTNFLPGQRMKDRALERGRQVQSVLVKLGEGAGVRANNLQVYLTLTDDVEDFNNMKADEFFRNVPGWGSGSGAGPTVTPPTPH